MRLILDTNAYVGFKLGHESLVACLVRADSILISPIVLGELLFGFRGGTRRDKNMEELQRFLDNPAVESIRLTEITADRYARIAQLLKKQGTPIPSNDIWIAAQAMETGAELITMDRHFKYVPGLVFTLFTHPPVAES